MTNKEQTILNLKKLKSYHNGSYGSDIDKAIKALEQESCDDAISRQAVLELVADYDLSMGQVVKGIHALPPVNLQEPKTGHWIKTPEAVMGEGYMWYCDKCKHRVYQDSSRPYPSENYCPNCGARMVEPQESEVQNADIN